MNTTKLILGIVVMIFVVAILLFVNRDLPGTDPYLYQCGSNIRQIAIGCLAYATEHEGILPKDLQQLKEYLPNYWGHEFRRRIDFMKKEEQLTRVNAKDYHREAKAAEIKRVTDEQNPYLGGPFDGYDKLFLSKDKKHYIVMGYGNMNIDEIGKVETSSNRCFPLAAKFYGKEGRYYEVDYYHAYWDKEKKACVQGTGVSLATISRFHFYGFLEIVWIFDAQGKNSLEGRMEIDFVNGNRVIYDKNGKLSLAVDRNGKILENVHKLPPWWNPNDAFRFRENIDNTFSRFACPSVHNQTTESYKFVATGNIRDIDKPEATPLVCETVSNHRGKRFVAYADGHIELCAD